MKAKKILSTVAIITALAVPFSVFAATSDNSAAKKIRGFFGIDASKLTDVQKADVTDYTKKMADLQKEFINKMASNGSMSSEQAEAAIQRIDAAVEKGTFSRGLYGMEFGDRGRKGGFGLFGADISKLTDAQKADLKESFIKMTELQKELINKEVASGLLTKEKGDAAVKKIDEAMTNDGFAMGMGRVAGFGMHKGNSSNLTEQQKADLEDYSKKMAEAQKELINKMVANGSITKEQGEAAIQRAESMDKGIEGKSFHKGMEMGRKGPGGYKR